MHEKLFIVIYPRMALQAEGFVRRFGDVVQRKRNMVSFILIIYSKAAGSRRFNERRILQRKIE